MEVEEPQTQQQQPPCKFSRVGNDRNDSTKLGHPHYHRHPLDGEEENGCQLIERHDYPITLAGVGNEGIDMNNNSITSINRLRGWHHSSRIIRVSRTSGGKDRHSKVWTSKGLRDRRVRLSVTTAIQFYDLQDRLGYDQPSKAVEWLIKAAADAIAELPSLNSSFPPDDTSPNHHQYGHDQKRREHLEAALDSVEADVDDVEQGNSQGQSQSQNQQEQHGSLSKSASSSTSETSKGSGLSLSRGDPKGNRVKARERARERTAKEKEKEKERDSSRVNNVHQHHHQHHNVNPISQNSTFTELLTAGIGNNNHNAGDGGRRGGSPNAASSESNLFHTAAAAAAAAAARQWPLTPMDYLSSGILSGTPAVGRSGFSGQTQLGNSMPQGMTMSTLVPQPTTPFSVSIGGGGESHNNSNHHQLEQLQHFPFVADHLILPVSAAGGGSGVDYNLNFTISSSSGLAAGFNRGTLQSNSSSSTSSPQLSLLTHLQRFSATATSGSANSSSPMDGSANNNVPFFIGAATTAMENHHNHHHQQQFPPGLQLLYGDGSRHSGHKGKGKS